MKAILMRKILGKIKSTVDSGIRVIFRFFPVNSRYILLESEGDYTDNIKVFYDYLIKEGYNNYYKIVWIVHEPKKYDKVQNVKFVSRYHMINIRSNYYASVAKYIIFSHPYWLRKWRKKQVVINTTHSVAQLKKAVNPEFHTYFDYILCCSEYCKEIKMQGTNVCEKQTLILGMPRLDLMYEHKECISQIVGRYSNKKIIVSMETFKQAKRWNDSVFTNSYALNVVHTLDELKEFDDFLEKQNCILIVKIHHLQDLSFIRMTALKNIIYLTDDELMKKDIQVNQLLENADMLLTDYSSVFYDFLLKDRPIGFCIGDIETYSRGFSVENPLEEMPGEKITTLQELEKFIIDSINGYDNYIVERKTMLEKVFAYQDNRNCERLFKWMQEYK